MAEEQKSPETFDDKSAAESGIRGKNKENPANEAGNEGGGEGEGAKSYADRFRERLGIGRGKNAEPSNLERAKNIAGAAEGNPMAIAKLAKDPKIQIIGALGGCSPLMFIIFFLILVMAIAGGTSASLTADLCKTAPKLSQDEKNQIENSPYGNALKSAADATGVNQTLIEAIDIKENKAGLNSPNRNTQADLINIGNRLQEANYKRGDDGKLAKDPQGNPIKGSLAFTGGPKATDSIAVAATLAHYKCVFVDNKDKAGNLDDPSIVSGCYKGFDLACVQNALKDKWMNNANPNNPGAFTAYLMVSSTAICNNINTAPIGSIGTPGTRGANNIPILTNYEQWDPKWASMHFDGGTIGGDGCSITSAAMVLAWYGCQIDGKPIDPPAADKIVNYSDAPPVFPELAAACGRCSQQRSDPADVENFLLTTHEPMVVNVGSTVDIRNPDGSPKTPWYTGGHYVAVAGFDGQNFYVNDPGVGGPDLTVLTKADFEELMNENPVKDNESFYKPANGESCK